MLSVRASEIGEIRGKLVLDFGSGAGRHAFWAVTQGAEVVAVDIAFTEIETVPEFFSALVAEDPRCGYGCAVQASGLELPFAAGIFDIVIASEVFEHIPDDKGAMREIYRILRPGGMLCVTVPRFVPEALYWAVSSEYHNVPGGHIRIYRRSQVFSLASTAGLRIIASHHAHAFHTPYWLIRCLVGVSNTRSKLFQGYHRFLVWEITRKPKWTGLAERLLNPLAGKSLVFYARKEAGGHGQNL